MGVDISQRTTSYLAENHSWLGSGHGTQECDGITLDGALLGAVFPTGRVPSGVVLAKVTATGRYGPYDDAQAPGDGRGVAAGHLFTTTELVRPDQGDAPTAYRNVGGALLWHGEVVEAKLPTNHGLDTAAKADLNQIRYV